MRVTALVGLASALLPNAQAAFTPDSNSNVVLYWGQNSSGTQQNLSYYCQSEDVDILVLSFITQFTEIPTTSFCRNDNCDDMALDIKTCQANGKKILLSMGDAGCYYGFHSDEQAKRFATTLSDLFEEGNSTTYVRPFGDAIVDGFDFDIENKQQTGYVALATQLKEYYENGTKDYYISVAPQCEYPDTSLSLLMSEVKLDFAFIQFYNNKCSIGQSFNWATCLKYATNVSPNKNIKLFLGLPGSETAATTGYMDISTIRTTINSISSSSNFGGIMLWDASQGFENVIDGSTFVSAVKKTMSSVQRVVSSSQVLSVSTLVTVGSNGSASTEVSSVLVSATSSALSFSTKSKSGGIKVSLIDRLLWKLITLTFFLL